VVDLQTIQVDGTRLHQWNGVSGCPAARPHFCVDEGLGSPDDNSTYVYFTDTNLWLALYLPTPNDPGGTWGWEIRLRGGKFGSGVASFSVDTYLAQDAVGISGPHNVLFTSGYDTTTISLDPSDIAGVTDLSKLEIWMKTGAAIISGAPQARLTAVELRLPETGQMQGSGSGVAVCTGAVLTASGALETDGASGAADTESPKAVLVAAGAMETIGASGQADTESPKAVLGAAGHMETTGASGAADTESPKAVLGGIGNLETDGAHGTSDTETPKAELVAAGHMTGACHGLGTVIGIVDSGVDKWQTVDLDFSNFNPWPLWNQLLVDPGPILYLRIWNGTDVLLDGRVGRDDDVDFFVHHSTGLPREWRLNEGRADAWIALRGGIGIRGSGSGPTSGRITLEALYQ